MKPILFNTEMVQAILDGRKTVTRRVINPQPEKNQFSGTYYWKCYRDMIGENEVKFTLENSPYKPYIVGDILYVRETFANTWTPDSEKLGFIYKADGLPQKFPYWGNAKQYKDEVWIPSIHMPREAARIFLKVTDIRVERLQDITDDDCISEGIEIVRVPGSTNYRDEIDFHIACGIATIEKFADLWNSTIKKQDIGQYDWNSNPYVWVILFEREDKPND